MFTFDCTNQLSINSSCELFRCTCLLGVRLGKLWLERVHEMMFPSCGRLWGLFQKTFRVYV